jgi:hypothetical protein
MNDVWQRYLGDIAKARKLDAAKLAEGIDQLPAGIAATAGDLAKYAVQQKLVDGSRPPRKSATCWPNAVPPTATPKTAIARCRSTIT